ncbi:E3 ubiquitin-protein ligase MARCHF3-like [Linepithema humile]|uniref:E3 ubiquitin-protein ligase MARCHF3-like n=1 Tax=Linepithema humile TaxID=83485 RepID=UPI000623AB48|nr:PREDICTED: E3 ubiquitin-protein ligase MARCH3-like [Linepithema humile]
MDTMLSEDLQSVMIHYPVPDMIPRHLDNSFLIDYPVCRRCNLGANHGELIRPCRCIGPMEFIHIHCLEAMANLNNIYYCTLCYYAFPIELRNKPLIEWLRNTDALANMLQGVFSSVLKMFGLILIDLSLATFAGYIITELDIAKIAKFIPLLVLVVLVMSVLFLGIPEWVRKMINFYTSFCESWRKFREKNQELKVIKGYYSVRRFVS